MPSIPHKSIGSVINSPHSSHCITLYAWNLHKAYSAGSLANHILTTQHSFSKINC